MPSSRSYNPNLVLQGRVLDIGCGRSKIPGSVGLDIQPYPGVDVVHDLNTPLPFADGEFDVVYSDQVFEHIPNLIGLIREIHRVLVPRGVCVAHVPYFRSSWAAIDPTHVRQFSIQSMNYFIVGTDEWEEYRFTEQGFSEGKVYLDYNYRQTILRKLLSGLAIRYPARFENSPLSFLYPFESLSFVLTK